MTHDDLIYYERRYMAIVARASARGYLTGDEISMLTFFLSFMRDRKREWEAGC